MLPQKKLIIEDLIRVLDVRNLAEKQMSVSYDALQNVTLPQVLEASLEQQYSADDLADIMPETKDAVIRKYSAKIVEKIRKDMSEKVDVGALMEGLFFDLYGKYYDEKELQAIIEFYKSPVGSKTIALMPQITAEAVKSMSDSTNKVMVEIYMKTMQEEMVAFNEELFPDECKKE